MDIGQAVNNAAGGGWTVDSIEPVGSTNQQDYVAPLQPTCTAILSRVQHTEGYGGMRDAVPGIGWNVVYLSKGNETRTAWVDASGGIMFLEQCILGGSTGESPFLVRGMGLVLMVGLGLLWYYYKDKK